MASYKIGITEAGDAGLDLSWEPKMDRVDGAILVTKQITPSFHDAALRNKGKVIIHATMTGLGGTSIEPNVPELKDEFRALMDLVHDGFPDEHVVIRIDPIIPTEYGINQARKVFDLATGAGFERFRVSVVDMYPHARKRFQKAGLAVPYGLNGFSPSPAQLQAVDGLLQEVLNAHPGVRIEACAEPGLKVPVRCGCVSSFDIGLLGLGFPEVDELGPQRKNCICYSGKQELLANKTQCGHGCLYCYWK